jgi:hypothetical protein
MSDCLQSTCTYLRMLSEAVPLVDSDFAGEAARLGSAQEQRMRRLGPMQHQEMSKQKRVHRK